MIWDVLLLVGAAWAVCAVLQIVLWAVSLRTRNAGIVDIGWAGSFTLIVGVFTLLGARLGRPSLAQAAPIAVMVVAWSLRLAGYLLARGAAHGDEEGRYQALRRHWGARASQKFFVFFQAQAAVAALLSVAFVLPFVTTAGGGALRVAGGAVWLIGFVGETVADAQLAAFKRDPARRGQVCDVGLWSLSRHPNYFFEWLIWCGYALYCLPYPSGAVAVVGPALILYTVLRVTGIPATERQAVRSKGDTYRRYQAEVSAFVPWPRRAAR